MANNEYKKIIEKKRIGNIEYQLVHLIKDDLFVICKWNKNLTFVQEIPEIFQSSSEKEAREYFKNLK